MRWLMSSSRTRRSAAITTAIVPLLAWTPATRAGLDESVRCDARGTQLGDETCSVSNEYGTALATAKAQYGILKSSVSASNSGRGFGWVDANGFAIFTDAVTIDSPGLTGQVGTVSVIFYPRWTMGAHAGFAKARYYFDTLGALKNTASVRMLELSDSGYIRTAQNDNIDVPYDSPMTATWQFRFGQAFTIRGTLSISSTAHPLFSSAQVNASNTVYWGGMTSVRHNDAEVEASVISMSGVDWSQSLRPTPRPTSN